MPIGKATIHRSVNNGPFVYVFEVDGTTQNAAVGVASLNAAVDAIKPLMGSIAGTIQRVVITVVSE